MQLILAQLLGILLIIGGVGYMFGGKSWAMKIVTWPFRKIWQQIERLLHWVMKKITQGAKTLLRTSWRLGKNAVVRLARWIWRQAKRISP